MSEYRVTYAEVPATRSDDGYDKPYAGVLLHIRPPVQLNPDAVAHYLTCGDLEPYDHDSKEWASFDIKHVMVLGSTPEQTTIYASIDKKNEGGGLAEQAAEDMVDLLRFMGAQAIIEHAPVPDA